MATRKKDNIRFFTAEQARKLLLESESQSSESDGEDSFSDDSQTKCTVVRGKNTDNDSSILQVFTEVMGNLLKNYGILWMDARYSEPLCLSSVSRPYLKFFVLMTKKPEKRDLGETEEIDWRQYVTYLNRG